MDPMAVKIANLLRGRVAVFLIMCGDLVALISAFAIALLLYYDDSSLTNIYRDHVAHKLPALLISFLAYVAIFWVFRLYRYAWRFAGLETLRGVVLGNILGLLVMCGTIRLTIGSFLPLSAIIIFLMNSIALVGCVRMILRLMSLSSRYGGSALTALRRDLRPNRVVILGSGSRAARLLYGLRAEMQKPYKVIGLLDDSPAQHGVYIHDVRVLGPLSLLFELLDSRAVDEVLIALPDLPGSQIREYVMACRTRKIPIRIMPALRDFLEGKTDVKLEEISVEDLLHRPAVRADMDEVMRVVVGKRVLVTGAGGSIGSELCRQIVKLRPSKLVLLGHGENSIHQIYHEMVRSDPALTDILCMAIASTADDARINQVFEEQQPQIVFHAAAHKHVPIMEINVLEAVHNNVMGTYNVAEVCGRNGIEHLVLISTDKAVYPSSTMGATKRVCEEIFRAMVPLFPNTAYVTVRFGNVLGSRGSAMRIFHDQIRRGGPVTVTHRDMTRFFMSIPEAVHLVLQACAIGSSGELYVLDMGSPVKIVDLAHDMIRLCGQEPDAEIAVVFTGIRPGEKLHEELTEAEESLMPARRKGLSIVQRQNVRTQEELFAMLRQMKQIIDLGDEKEARDLLHEMIPRGASRMLVGKP